MVDDRTEFQTDIPRMDMPRRSVHSGPARRWYYQRLLTMISFAAACWWPVIEHFNPEAAGNAIYWYGFHGSVVLGWLTGSTVSSLKR